MSIVSYAARALDKFTLCVVFQSGDPARRNPLCNFCHSSDSRTWYDDSYYWDVPEEEEEEEEEISSSGEESTEEP